MPVLHFLPTDFSHLWVLGLTLYFYCILNGARKKYISTTYESANVT